MGAPSPPPSSTNGWANLSGLVGLVIATVLIARLDLAPATRALLAMSAVAVPIVGAEQLVFRRRIAWRRPFAPGRVLVKLVGLAGTVAILAAAYWLFPVYRSEFYDPFFQAVRQLGPYLAVLAAAYVALIDRTMEEPEDGYYHAGLLCLGLRSPVRRGDLTQYALGWLVKGFFLPLMFCYLCEELSGLASLAAGGPSWGDAFDLFWRFSWTTDLAFSTVGYLLALRLFQAEIRSVEPTLFGWLVCLLCYRPFDDVFSSYTGYEIEPSWQEWAAGNVVLTGVWGAALLACMATYVWATVSFGVRFSNLTNRGILTNGPYRYTKHPAYLSKNVSWWLLALPGILSADFPAAARICLMLGLVNLVYFLRARTEERHLSFDPAYVVYAKWIARHGALRFLAPLRQRCSSCNRPNQDSHLPPACVSPPMSPTIQESRPVGHGRMASAPSRSRASWKDLCVKPVHSYGRCGQEF